MIRGIDVFNCYTSIVYHLIARPSDGIWHLRTWSRLVYVIDEPNNDNLLSIGPLGTNSVEFKSKYKHI